MDADLNALVPIYTKGTANSVDKLGLNGPVVGMALDPTDHRFFLSDTSNHRVLVYTLDVNNTLPDRIPDNVLGQLDFYSNAAANTQAGMNTPNGIAFDDTNNRLFVAQRASTTSARVTVYDVTAITDGENAVNVLGQATFTVSTAATTQEGMNAPIDVAYDSTNNRLFVAQSTGNRVTVYDVATICDGEAATAVLGQSSFTTATAATTQAGMNVPTGLAYDNTNNRLFVSEATSNRVLVFTGSAIATGMNAAKVLGQANFTTATAATTQIGMNAPYGIAYDGANNLLYVAEATGNRVKVYSGSVLLLTDGMNAAKVLGQLTFTATAAASTQAGLNSPLGVLPDAANNLLYVLQSGASRVSIFDIASITNGEAAVDVLGQFDDNLTTPAPIYTKGTANNVDKRGLSAPQGIAVDATNHRLFVADSSNNRILVYNLTSGNAPIDIIPDNVLGQLNFYSNAVATTQAGLSSPTGLDFDASNNKLYAADLTNNRILLYDTASITDGENAVAVLGQVNYTTATAGVTQLGLSAPRQIAYDSTTRQLFVADGGNSRVVIYDVSTIVDGENAIAMLGQTDAGLSAPVPIYTKGTANNAPDKLSLSAPVIGMALDSVGNRLFVSDTINNRVLVYNLNANDTLIDRIPDNVLGQTTFYTNAAGATQTGFETPNGLALSGSTTLFVAEGAGSRVKVFDIASITDGENAANVLGQTTWAGTTAATTQGGMSSPADVVYDSTNKRLFVSDYTLNRVTVYDLSPGIKDGMSADNAIGQTDSSLSDPQPIYTKTTAHNGPNKLGVNAPTIGIALDATGHRLFLSDTSNNRVLAYNLDANNALLDRIPDNVLGQLNYISNTAVASQTGFETPYGLALSGSTTLFVAEGAGSRVKVFDITSITDGENAANVLGQTTWAGTTAATTQVGMSLPVDVAYDSTGKRLFVADYTLNRVTTYDVTTITNGEAATAVLGQATFTAATAATTQAGMNLPYGLAYDSTNNRLFVSDSTSNRVLVFTGSAIVTGMNAANVLGQSNFTTATAAVTQAGMSGPRGIVYDSVNQMLYVAEATGNRVKVYSGSVLLLSNGMNAAKVLGQTTWTGTTAASTQAGLNAPNGVAIDETNHLLYVPQSGANRVSVFDVTGITDGENAVDALGQYDDNLTTPGPIYTKSVAHNGPSKLGLSAPVIGMALDATGHRLFVSDTGNNRVLVYNLDSNDLLVDRIPDNVLGQLNFYSNAAATTQTGMNVPNGIAFDDDDDRLFVAQGTGNRVTVYDVAAITDGENAVHVLGQVNFTTATAATTQIGMNVPFDVAYDSANGRLFVSEGTGNRVKVYSGSVLLLSDGMNAANVLGQTTWTGTTAATTQAGMNAPRGLAYDSANTRLFVAQATGNRVTVYSGSVLLLSNGMNAANVLGQVNFTATALGNTQTGMNDPRGIAYDATNNRLYVSQATGNRITMYDTASITDGENAINVFGQQNFTTIAAAVAVNGLSAPTGVLADPAHNRLYALESTANRVVTYHLTDGIGTGQNASYVLGQANFTAATAATTQIGMNVPYGLAYDSTNNLLYVSEGTSNRVLVFTGSLIATGMNAAKVLGQANFTTATAAVTQAGMSGPRGLVYDSTHQILYVSQTTANRVTTYDVAAITDGENAVNVLGQPTFTTTAAGSRQSGLNAPNGVAIDAANHLLYVLQSGASRVSVFDVTSVSDGENAVDALGQYDDNLTTPGPIYWKGTANNASHKLGLSTPQGIAVDATNHRLFVADSSNNRILVYNLTSGNVPIDLFPDNVLGQTNYYTNTVTTTQAGLSSPTGLTFDAINNKLYAADFTNNRILIYDTASITDGENAVAVLGQPSYIVATAGITQLGLSGPRQIAYDSASGQLFVADATNSRVVLYTPSQTGTTTGNSFYFYGF